MQKTLFILISLFLSVPIFSQEKVIWYSIEEAEKKMSESSRPLFIDTYTDWCGWCKKMDMDTFTHPVIAEILNKYFYPVKFDAEGEESVTFLGQTFINDGKAGKAHQLAVTLLQGQLAYPTVVILTPVDDKIYVSPIPGYKEPKEMELLLSYFSDSSNRDKDFEVFQGNFKSRIEE